MGESTGHPGIVEVLLHMFCHAQLEAEVGLYRLMPGVLAPRTVEILRGRFGRVNLNGYTLEGMGLEDLVRLLMDEGYVKGASFEVSPGRAVFKVEGCRFAEIVHPNIEREYLCPYAVLAMAILDREYEVSTFEDRMPELTEDGSITHFKIEPRIEDLKA